MFHRAGISTILLFCGMLLVSSAMSIRLFAQKDTATPIGEGLAGLLQHMHANLMENEELARQYACNDRTHTVVFSSSGKKTRDDTAKFEYAVIDGLPYIHKVEQNGVPLSAKKMALEQKHQDALSQNGRGLDFVFDLRDGNPSDSIYSALPICCLVSLFENRVLRREQINGRDNLVIESVPKPDAQPSSEDERTALDWKETTWIDADDLIPTRYEVELLNDERFLLKGSTERRDFIQFKDSSDPSGSSPQTVWLESTKEDHSKLKFLWQRVVEDFEDTSYDYKKFKVDLRLLEDSVQEIPNQGPKRNP
jgi:hypothetical protein